MIGVFNTKDDSHEFSDKVQPPTLGIHHITYITHTGSTWHHPLVLQYTYSGHEASQQLKLSFI